MTALVARGLDWDLLLRLAAAHRMSRALHDLLDDRRVTGVPTPVREGLRVRVMEATTRGLRLCGQLLEAASLIDAHGIPVLAFKGPVLSLLAYGGVGQRVFNDLDLLVRRVDLPTVRRLLERGGYRLPPRYRRALSGPYPRSEHHYVFYPDGKPEGGVTLEVHAEPVMWYFGVDWPTDGLLARAVQIDMMGTRLRTLSREDTALHLAVHGAVDAWPSLEAVRSFAALVVTWPALDWDEILRRARELGVQRAVLVANLLAAGVAGVGLPPAIERAVAADPSATRLAARLAARMARRGSAPRLALERLAFHVAIRERGRDKARYMWRSIANVLVQLSNWIWPPWPVSPAPRL
jgi:hypothetical protein